MKGKNQGGHCRCDACGERFTGLRPFDMHRAGEYAMRKHTRRCLSTAEMRAKDMQQSANGAWNTGREFNRERLTA